MAETKGSSVSLKTFNKWNVGHIIGYKLDRNDTEVVEVWCKTCAKFSDRLRSHLKGKALRDAERYITGTNSVTKGNISRHLNDEMHRESVGFEKVEKPNSTLLQAQSASGEPQSASQPESASTSASDDMNIAKVPQPRIDSFIWVHKPQRHPPGSHKPLSIS